MMVTCLWVVNQEGGGGEMLMLQIDRHQMIPYLCHTEDSVVTLATAWQEQMMHRSGHHMCYTFCIHDLPGIRYRSQTNC